MASRPKKSEIRVLAEALANLDNIDKSKLVGAQYLAWQLSLLSQEIADLGQAFGGAK